MVMRPVVAGLGLLLVAVSLPGCGERSSTTDAEADRSWDRYAVRGRIVKVIDGGRQLSIHHEAIPGFIGHTGEVVGMGAMVMILDVAEGEAVGELAAGDPVGFTLAHSWQPLPIRTQVEQVRRLPAQTVLSFDPVDPVEAVSEGGGEGGGDAEAGLSD